MFMFLENRFNKVPESIHLLWSIDKKQHQMIYELLTACLLNTSNDLKDLDNLGSVLEVVFLTQSKSRPN